MARGIVANLHALVPVTLPLFDGEELTIEFVVDTGFTGALALPPRAVELIGLSFLRDTTADLADGSTLELAVYSTTILWHESRLEVEVIATGARPLLGTALLAGCELRAQFVEEGVVTIVEM
jgi:clan AA aspartic protease